MRLHALQPALAILPLALALCGAGAFAQAAAPVAGLASTQAQPYRFTCASGSTRAGVISLSPAARYAAGTSPSGFDIISSPQVVGDSCTSSSPFFLSAQEPDGNYRVTVVLGSSNQPSVTTVKAESRRLMLQQVATASGKFQKYSFVVNVRSSTIAPTQSVRLKPREIGSLDWDEKLTLQFSGDHPSVRSVVIEPVQVPTVYLAGDSTVVDQDKEPWAAWGQMLPSFFNDKVAIANHAESGETIHSFVSERRFDKIMTTLRAGDYLFMQFAHNDQKAGSGFVPIPLYQDLLRKYVALARSRGATPVLVTSMNRRLFNPDDTIQQTLAGYPDAMRAVAAEQHVALIDLNAMSKTLFEAMGPAGTLRAFVHYPAHTFPNQAEELHDDTHFNSYGAMELAKCVIQGIRQDKLQLARQIRHGIPQFNPAHPDAPDSWTVPSDPFLSAQTPYER